MVLIYLIAAALVTFVSILFVPSKMHPIDNLGGSLVAAICFGWLVWPVAFIAAAKQMKQRKKLNG